MFREVCAHHTTLAFALDGFVQVLVPGAQVHLPVLDLADGAASSQVQLLHAWKRHALVRLEPPKIFEPRLVGGVQPRRRAIFGDEDATRLLAGGLIMGVQ